MKKIITLIIVLILSLGAFNNIYANSNIDYMDSKDKAFFYADNLKQYKSIKEFEDTIENINNKLPRASRYSNIEKEYVKKLVGEPIEVSYQNKRIKSGNTYTNMVLINETIYINVADFANIIDFDYFRIEPIKTLKDYEVNFDGYAYVYRQDDNELIFRDMIENVIMNNKIREVEGSCISTFAGDGREISSYIPLRLASELLGYKVEYDKDKYNIPFVMIYK